MLDTETMQWAEVVRRTRAGEDAVTEFKRGIGDMRAVGRTLCAFANGAGGLLVLGIDDAGAIVGVSASSEAVQERLTGLLHTGCGKPISAQCGRHDTAGGWVHWIDVRRHQRGYEPFMYDGRFWVRRGRATVAPSPSELQELLNAFGFVLTEQQIVPAAHLDDIDFGAVRSFMQAQGLDTEQTPQPAREDDLQNASVIDELDGALRPTLYGLMVFGRDPQAYPHTLSLFVQCAAYGGTDQAAEVLSAGEAKGRLADQVNRAMGWFRSLGRREAYEGLRRRDISPLPERALREALVNAVIHRDYAISGSQTMLEVFADRVVVTSPGALPNHMTVEQARSGGAPRSRNEMMANAMVVAGLMERRGRGWLTMRHAMRDFNGTEPELASDQHNRFVRVTFHLQRATDRG
ncbi:MAG: putative DNA binding domain-containing protein [Spirochaetaceae bacterium]|nr:putative DNA binding domain-containing protein [Spirochaetaceae bacterium]